MGVIFFKSYSHAPVAISQPYHITQKPTVETVGYMMEMMFFESGIISQKPTVETVGYMMGMMFFKSGITDFDPGQRGWTAFRHCPNISVGATRRDKSRLYGTSTYRNEISRWDGVLPMPRRGESLFAQYTPAHFISPLPGKQDVCKTPLRKRHLAPIAIR